jgi:hypothetical protein
MEVTPLMIEEKKDENLEALLEKSLIALQAQRDGQAEPEAEVAPTATVLNLADHRPTCSLIQNKPTRPYKRMNKRNNSGLLPKEDSPAVIPQVFTHERACVGCDAVIRVTGSNYPRGTCGADWEARNTAILSGWNVCLRISGHLEYTCPRCALKARAVG